MKLLGNILWLILGGLLFSFLYFIVGIILCITIIGIPFGLQMFKLGKLVIWPFGKEVKTDFNKHPIMNILWLFSGGISSAGGHLFFAGLTAITIIGIPFAKQHVKMAITMLFPFGAIVS